MTVTRRNVSVGHEDIRLAILTEGVKPGDRVVVDGASRLTDGGKITISTPPGAAPATPAAPATGPRPGGRPAAGGPGGRAG